MRLQRAGGAWGGKWGDPRGTRGLGAAQGDLGAWFWGNTGTWGGVRGGHSG